MSAGLTSALPGGCQGSKLGRESPRREAPKRVRILLYVRCYDWLRKARRGALLQAVSLLGYYVKHVLRAGDDPP